MRRNLPDLAIIALLFLLPLLMFWGQTVGGQTLLPTENLYQYEPLATYREAAGAPEIPHNHLLSDLVLQNYQWKSLLRASFAEGEIPLWNPHQFSGIPFMAAGQQSTLYPLSVLYYGLPLPAAYGWFTVVNLWLAGALMYGFLRGLGMGRMGGAVAGIVYQLCGFFIASVVFPMIIGAAVWLPLMLLMTEFIIRRQTLLGQQTSVPWVVIGAVGLAFNIFAGHVELTLYTLLITAYYAVLRLLWEVWQGRGKGRAAWLEPIKSGAWIAVMVALGFGLGAIQFIPLYEFVSTNWRAERNSLETVLGFAHPLRDVLQFVMPNFYGSPAHQSYFDLFSMQRVTDLTDFNGNPINFIDWGIKNYVEGALYLGILPLVLAAFALIEPWITRGGDTQGSKTPPYRVIFAGLALISLSFMFGLPTYAAVYVLPGINQLNSPFRWIFGVTVAVAVLAGFGADALARKDALRPWAKRGGYAFLVLGGVILLGLLGSRLLFGQLEGTLNGIVQNAALAERAFADGRMFYSYQFGNMLIFGLMLLGTGGVFLLAARSWRVRGLPVWQLAAVLLIAADLMIASWGFNPASDPDLLEYIPPSIEWLQDQQAENGDFRYITLEAPAEHLPLFQANMTLRYGLDDVRGYDSIISAQYVDYMRDVAIQPQLDFNRVAPLYMDRLNEVDWQRLALLNVRYVITHRSIDLPQRMAEIPDISPDTPDFTLAFESEAVRIWEVPALPRAYLLSLPDGTDLEHVGSFDVATAMLDTAPTLTSSTSREKFINVDVTQDAWLVISETYAPGWRALIRPLNTGDDAEREIDLGRVLQNFQGIRLNPDELSEQFEGIDTDQYTLRLVYSPTSFQVGLFGSIISGALIAFLLGVWIWRLMIGSSTDESTTASRVARNSIAPILLNLFNRGIDFVFAFVMLRILGPADAGIYFYAVVIFVWFDIITNFGLDVFLIREVSRDRSRSGYFFLNTSSLRLLLMVACIPLVIGFLLVRQATIEPALSQEAILAIGLLYIGLAPASLSKGLTSLFYAYEKAEIPAALTTITTINKSVFGLIALLLGFGIVGLAGVSIVVNIVTLAVLVWMARGMIGQLQRPDSKLMRGMVNESWPLMLNHFLATIFFQIDVVILEAMRGAVIVGQYSTAYKWLQALNVIPAFFTQALLPIMSRQANEDRAALKRTYTLGIKLLVSVALPLAVVFTFLAEALTLLLGGAQYLPNGAIALQIMIWSIPIGWMNSLTQYALIAVDLQRRITLAFIVAVSFNIITNVTFIPIYGFQAAAVTTIFSEAVLLVPFGLLMHGALGPIPWLDLVWRPIVASAVMFAVMAVLWPLQPLIALMVGSGVYPVLLLLLRPLNDSERAMLLPVLPERVRRFVPV